MCDNCFQTLIYSFKSHQDFEAFEDELQRKCTNKQLTIIDRHNSDFYSAFDTYMYINAKAVVRYGSSQFQKTLGVASFFQNIRHWHTAKKLKRITERKAWDVL